MWRTIIPILAVGLCAGAYGARAADNSSTSARTKDGCKVIERKADNDAAPGTLSSSVTAGNGKVSGYTTGDNSVTIHSGDGKTSSSVATAGSSGGSTVVAGSGNGDCTIYVDPGHKSSDRK